MLSPKRAYQHFGCGHDHVNDFCALLPQEQKKSQQNNHETAQFGPWLCYAVEVAVDSEGIVRTGGSDIIGERGSGKLIRALEA
jgi:hypothetical protein